MARDGRPVGWALTGRTPPKSRHLEANPHASCSFWSPSQDAVFADVIATWVEDEAEKEAVWRVFERPQPDAWGPEGMAGGGEERWRSPSFTPLRLDPWRV